MYDFIKFKAVAKEEMLLSHEGLDFECKTSKRTGEVLEYPMTTKRRYKGQEFVMYPSCIIGNGSIHKYFQNGKNWKDFDIDQFNQALSNYCLEFGINADNARLQNLEYGVNIETTFEHSKENLKRMFVSYKGKPFEFMEVRRGKECLGVVCKLSQFQIKIYSKTMQYDLDRNILRIEIKCTRIQKISTLPLYLSDLLESYFITERIKSIIDILKDLILIDDSLMGLTEKEKVFLLQASNPNYWNELQKTPRSRAKQRYNKLVLLKSSKHIQKEIIQTVVEKCNLLTMGVTN